MSNTKRLPRSSTALRSLMAFQAGLLVSMATLAGCGGGGGGGGGGAGAIGQADEIAPTVVATSPAEADTEVATDRLVTVTFSEPMDAATVNEDTFQVLADGQALSGVVSYTDQPEPTATFTADGGLPDSENLAVSLSNDATDLAGNALEAAVDITFVTVDLVGPEIQMDFPGGKVFTTGDRISLAGVTRDISRLQRVEVNGAPVESTNGLVNWRFEVQIFDGDNSIRIVAEDERGNVSRRTVRVRNDTLMTSVTDVAPDLKRDQMVVASGAVSRDEISALFTVSFETGQTTLVSKDGERGEGPDLGKIGGVTVPNNDDLAYVTDTTSGSIIEVDLLTGDRVEISGPNQGSGPRMSLPTRLVFEFKTNSFFVVATGTGDVFKVSRANGDREVFSGELINPSAIAVQVSSSELFVADRSNGQIHGINALTGFNRVISDSTDSGPELDEPVGLAFLENGAFSEFYVSDRGLGAIVKLDFNGNREIFGQIGDGRGPLESLGGIEMVDGSAILGDTELNAVLIANKNVNRTVMTRASVATGPRLRDARRLTSTTSGALVTIKKVGTVSELLVIDPNDGVRQTADDAFGAGSGPEIREPRDVTGPASGSELFIIDVRALPETPRILAIDTSNGNRRIVTSDEVGEGESLPNSQVLTANADGSKLWVNSFGRIVEVDTETGNRTLVTGNGRGAGPFIDIVGSMVLDQNANRLLVGFGEDILTIDLETGDRAVFSDKNDGGPVLAGFNGLALDAANGRLIAAGFEFENQDSLIAVNLINGARDELSGEDRGQGTLPSLMSGLVLDAENGRAFVSDQRLNAVFIIDLESGDRAVMSK